MRVLLDGGGEAVVAEERGRRRRRVVLFVERARALAQAEARVGRGRGPTSGRGCGGGGGRRHGDAAERAGHVGIAVRMRRAMQHPAVREPLALPVAPADHQHVRNVRTEAAFRGVQAELHEKCNNDSTSKS